MPDSLFAPALDFGTKAFGSAIRAPPVAGGHCCQGRVQAVGVVHLVAGFVAAQQHVGLISRQVANPAAVLEPLC